MAQSIRYPNDRTNPAGAIPVFMSSSPKAIPIQTFAGPAGPNYGPIPVRVVGGLGAPPIGNDQGIDNNAIPVFESTAPNAMPVWDAAPTPLPPEVNEVTFSRPFAGLTVPTALGICTCTNGPATWSIIDPGGLNLMIATGSGQLLLMTLAGANIGVYDVIVQASNSDGTGQGPITIEFT